MAALYGPLIQETLDEIRDELRNRGRQDGARWKMPVANLRTRLDPRLVGLGFTVGGLLRQAARLGRPRMGLEGDEAYYEEPGTAPPAAPSATTRGDQAELLQAYQDWATANGDWTEGDKTRLRILLGLPSAGSNVQVIQAAYRRWLRADADGWGLAWAKRVYERMGFGGTRLPWDTVYWVGPYTPRLMYRTMQNFIDFIERNDDIRRRLFT